MTTQPIRVTVEHGLLRPVTPLDLPDGQQLDILIVGDWVTQQLTDLLAPVAPAPDIDTAELWAVLAEASTGEALLSAAIIAERHVDE